MTLDRIRLARLLGMLGSSSQGERDNAAVMAQRLVRDSGETWDGIILNGHAPDAELRYTQEDLRYAYEKGRKEGAEEERTREKISNASAFHRTDRKGQEWRDFAKEALELNQTYPGRARLSPAEIDVLTKFLSGGWIRPTPRQAETFFVKISNKCGLELPE